MASLDRPYRCPRCGERKRFHSLSSLRAHLEHCHSYETLYVLSKPATAGDRALVPLISSAPLPLISSAPLPLIGPRAARGRHVPCELQGARELGLGLGGAGCPPLTRLEFPLADIFAKNDDATAITTAAASPSTAVAVATGAAYEEGLARLRARAWEERLEERLERLSEEVERRIAARVGRLQAELEERSVELEEARREGLRLGQEKLELEVKASELSRQVDVSVEMLAALKQDLETKEQELTNRQQEVSQIDQFLQETAAREANAKLRLQQFIEELLDRADRAEKQLQTISSCGTTPNGSLGHCSGSGSVGTSDPRNSSGSGGSRGVYRVSDRRSSPNSGVFSRMQSQGSGAYDSDGADVFPLEERAEAQYYRVQCTLGECGYERAAITRSWGLRKQAIQNRQRRPRRSSAEGGGEEEGGEEEEGDESDPGSRTAESEVDVWDPDPRAPPDTPPHSPSCRAGPRQGSGPYKPCRRERGSPARWNAVISPEVLKTRAALFCVFTYLDARALLRAAEVCRDWRFVARHPAVWTRVLLENGRVSSKFLITLSQWCTQTHSLILQNLKPRQRGKKESKEEYLKSTRGCLEEGLEAILKATDGNLLILKVSHCPNILTDRSLWLASCYCRTLQAVTYRSATDPVGQEVIWALGAGCRDIISLQVAPLHPCQQPTRFSNRCLQTIGRCWPHLRALGVGGPGCGIQGLTSLARNCMRLQVLELDHVGEVNQELAAEVCREGLKGLEMLVLTSTPVTPKALLHFNSVCRNLKSIVVQIGIADYFEDPNSPEAGKLFEEMLEKLQALKKRPGFSKILHVKAEGVC
ncbi:F-box only protein 41-like [Anguilla anguilla]|uniref:F-box only protein 41-like n=1 Tax=Anguilla anguilla TaxID=7936 RepID=UPI0015A9E126|nr:F-box only protein 41-like [Anguilla anguilla]